RPRLPPPPPAATRPAGTGLVRRRAPAPRDPPGDRAQESRARQRLLAPGRMKGVLGWDIGGVNTKAARVAGSRVVAVRAVPYEIQRDPTALAPLLARLAGALGGKPADAHGATMTAELSQILRTTRDGAAGGVAADARAFPECVV